MRRKRVIAGTSAFLLAVPGLLALSRAVGTPPMGCPNQLRLSLRHSHRHPRPLHLGVK